MKRIAALAVTIVLLAPAFAFAQLNGANILGDTGVDTGTQPLPGVYVGGLYYRYRTDTIRKADGTRLSLDPSQPTTLAIPAFAPTFAYVAKPEFLGGHFGVFVAPGVTTSSLEAPGIGLDRTTSTGPADTYIVPAQVGWHFDRADLTTAFGIWAPTGRYSAGATTNNTGRGMWTWEESVGTTLYLDPARTFTLATTALLEQHTTKEGTAVNLGPSGQIALGGVRVGDILSLEGGLAYQFLKGAAHAGVAYYAQWKLTNDDFGLPTTPAGGPLFAKHRVFGVGPDVTAPIGSKSALIALVNVRYFWETGAEVKTEGSALVVSMTFPVPSMKTR